MNSIGTGRIAWRKGLLGVLAVALVSAAASPVVAASDHLEPVLRVGDRAPHFSVATSQDTLIDYDRDYYGSHHLVLTFFPAAFTPV
jgi:hypothetical protein